jgi:hypothetical protein
MSAFRNTGITDMKTKTKVKTMVAEVVLKGKKAPDFGLGKGVISTFEIDFKDNGGRGFDSPIFVMAVAAKERELIQDAVKVRWTEKKNPYPVGKKR